MNEKTKGKEPESAASLLREAAALVDRALLKLDATTTPCPHCSTRLAADVDGWALYKKLADTPERLRNAATSAERNLAFKHHAKGYDVARRWFLERGEQGESLGHEAVRLLFEVSERSGWDITSKGTKLRDEIDGFLLAAGQTGPTRSAT